MDHCTSLLLVGREPTRLKRLFPDLPSCTIEDISVFGKGFDSVVHLAVLNNDFVGDEAEFRKVNIDLTLRVAEMATTAGVGRFYNISSIHALDKTNSSAYAESKRAAAKTLARLPNIDVVNIYLPYVRGATWNGKLSFLNFIPSVLARPITSLLLASKPSVHAKELAEFILMPDCPFDTVILSEGQNCNLSYRVIKRSIDLIFAFAVVGLLWWALIIIWVLVKQSSYGSGFFAQERVGRGGVSFICYKFRTMQEGTVQAGTHEISGNAVTRIGRFLRRTKLDELPQVWNIFKNEMSLIGPRPSLPVQTDLFAMRQARGIFDIKPGISGLAQISNIDMSDPAKLVEWDSAYIALQSLKLDLKILLATIRGSGQGDKVIER